MLHPTNLYLRNNFLIAKVKEEKEKKERKKERKKRITIKE
jgi:hypothetical protein